MVKRMNQLGMVVETVHCNEVDIAAVSDQQVMCSHTCCRAVHHGYAANRNITDKGLKAIADKGVEASIRRPSIMCLGKAVAPVLGHW